MDILLSVLKVVFGFGILITVHELGHALAAILCGVKIEKFSIGVGPGWKIKNVPKLNEIVISPFIFFGYIQINIEDLNQKSFFKKFIFYISGILANILLAIVLLIVSNYGVRPAIQDSILFIKITLSMIIGMLDGSVSIDMLIGPIGIGKMLATATNSYLLLIVSLSLGLAAFNLLFLPPLDGGRILISLLEKIFGPQKMKKISISLMKIGIILLLTLFVFMTYNDIIKLFANSQIK